MLPDYLSMFLADHDCLSVENPATGEVVAKVAIHTLPQISAMIDKATSQGRAWAARTAGERAAVLKRWHSLIMGSQEELAAICTMECGKPFAESLGEVAYAASFVEWFAEEGKRTYGETIPTFAQGKRVLTLKQPVGTCAAITPWNFPLAMITRKVAPALAAGCAMLVKPAEATPLSALALEGLAAEAGLPQGLFRIVCTEDPVSVGKLFCEHPQVSKLSFTGSTAVGKTLLAQAAGTVKRVSMELGGNAPFIIFSDADIDAAVEGFMLSKFRNAGQTCVCANRLLVHDSIREAVFERLLPLVRKLKVGPGNVPQTQVGPLINRHAVQKVAALVRGAVEQGAIVLEGGEFHPAGPQFFQPTVLDGVTAGMTIANTEIFGPVVSVISFKTEEEALRIANSTPYGLAAYFYSRDIGRIWRVMEGLEYGMVAVNEGALSTEVAPFGGVKESGLGREGSRYGIEEYLEIKYSLIGGLAA